MSVLKRTGEWIWKVLLVIIVSGLFGVWNLIYAFFHGYTINEFFRDIGMVTVGMVILLGAIFGIARIMDRRSSLRR